MDIVQLALDRAAFGGYWAPPAAFAAGLATSFGPCVAPRFLAISGAVADAAPGERFATIGVFSLGLTCAYVVLALGARILVTLGHYSVASYAVLASVLFVFGLRAVLGSGARCSHRSHGHPRSYAAMFAFGASFALVLSPCCTPVVASLAVLTSGTQSPLFAATVVGAFAAGHAFPLLVAGCGARGVAAWSERTFKLAAVDLVGGALMMAMAGYYAVLA